MYKYSFCVHETPGSIPGVVPTCHPSKVDEWEPVYTGVKLCVNHKYLTSGYLIPSPNHTKNKSLKSQFILQEKVKKCSYNQRVIEIEYGSFTRVVLSAYGGTGRKHTTSLKPWWRSGIQPAL